MAKQIRIGDLAGELKRISGKHIDDLKAATIRG